jgi:hypothetical protein
MEEARGNEEPREERIYEREVKRGDLWRDDVVASVKERHNRHQSVI